MRNRILVLGLLLLSFSSLCFGEEANPQKDLKVKLTMDKKAFKSGDKIELKLRVENKGKAAIRLFRPRSGKVTRIYELGWAIVITGSKGTYTTLPEPRGVYAATERDVIELAPGESVGATAIVNHYAHMTKTTVSLLKDEKGEFTAVLKYKLDNAGPYLFEKNQKAKKADKIFLGPLESNKVTFKIGKG